MAAFEKAGSLFQSIGTVYMPIPFEKRGGALEINYVQTIRIKRSNSRMPHQLLIIHRTTRALSAGIGFDSMRKQSLGMAHHTAISGTARAVGMKQRDGVIGARV